MKILIICLLALGGVTLFTSCISVQRAPSTRQTTVEQTTVSRPRSTTVETETVRSY